MMDTKLNVRDYFAAKVMEQRIAQGYCRTWEIAEFAYEMADAMLEARDKTSKKE